MPATVSSSYLRLLIDYSGSRGLTRDIVMTRVGVRAEELDDPDLRVDGDDFVGGLDFVARELGEPHVGLRIGRDMRPAYLGVYGYVLFSCRTLGDAEAAFTRFSALAMNLGHNSVELRPDEYVLRWHSALPAPISQRVVLADLIASSWVTMARLMSGRPQLRPLRVTLPYQAPDQTALHDETFGCAVEFAAPELSISFDPSLRALTMLHGDDRVYASVKALCERLLKGLAGVGDPDWLAATRKAVVDALASGVPTLTQVAQCLGVTPGVLRMRLTRHGIGYQSLVDELRHELADAYLADRSLSLVDIAFLLGFSEQSAFQRAFKRWTGRTPGEVRRGAVTSEASVDADKGLSAA